MYRSLVLFFVAVALGAGVVAKQPRSAAAVLEFKRHNPCPSTGQRRGACPGYVVDHVVPLCANGEDHPRNMQWQSVADAIEKDKDERRQCRALRRR